MVNRKNTQRGPLIGAHAIPTYVKCYIEENENNPKPNALVFTYQEGRGDGSLYSLIIIEPKPNFPLNDSVKGLNLEGTAADEFEASDIARRIIRRDQCMIERIALLPLNSQVSGYQLYSKPF